MTENTESVEFNNDRGGGNMSILEPDIGLGDHLTNRNIRNHDHSQREERSISFRRFLQDSHGNSSTHPDLYSCVRHRSSDDPPHSAQRSLNEGSPVDPESPDLPDFVQDHLAVEQIYFNDTTSSAASSNLPDFASFIDVTRNQDLEHVERLRCNDQVPLDFLPNATVERSQANSRSAFDLSTDSSKNNIASNSCRLPDFLSHGPFFGADCSSQSTSGIPSVNYSNESQDVEERTSVSMLERDNERLREELQILRSVLLKKDDRIKELEDIVMALEISKLQMQTDANTQTVTKSCENSGEGASKPRTDHLENSDAEKLEAFSVACRNDGNPNLALKVKEMTNVSERLVRELLKIITDFQFDINKEDLSLSAEGQSATTDTVKKSDNSSSSSSSTYSHGP